MDHAEGTQISKLPAAIRTRRLTLRRVRLEDVDDVFSFACEDIWMRLLPDARQPYELRDAERWVARRFLAPWRTEPTWAIEVDGRVVGWVGLNIEPEHAQAELSYAVRPDLRSQGLATEAVRAVVDRVFLDTQLGRVWGRVDPPNVASVRVLEKAGDAARGRDAPRLCAPGRTDRPGGLRNVANRLDAEDAGLVNDVPLLPQRIETARLVLRRWTLADADDVLAYAADPEWSRFLPVPKRYERRHSEEFVAGWVLQDWSTHPGWAIEIAGARLEVSICGSITSIERLSSATRWLGVTGATAT